MINSKRFPVVDSTYIEDINGQSRFGYGIREWLDLNDAKEIFNNEGYFIGMTLRFFDFVSGETFEPFPVTRNIAYGNVVFHDELFYFLQADFGSNVINLISYYPDQETNVVTTLDMNVMDLDKLKIIGNGVHVVNQKEDFVCYYPESFALQLEDEETVVMMDEDKLYINQWIEEEIDTGDEFPKYNYYDKLVIKNFEGESLSEEIGYLQQHKDGKWWIS
ncbi:hypothetical protein ACMGE6_06675 [Macrococcus equi]|uniref:hypothetical protein n=1 Tax=Macrococcus equi TaxID=3395462 RepID=UPI0039BE480B